MKPGKEKKNDFFDLAKSISEVSQIGNAYGRLAELRDLQVHIQTRINELEKEYKKVKRLTRKQMLRLLSLPSNALLDYELH